MQINLFPRQHKTVVHKVATDTLYQLHKNGIPYGLPGTEAECNAQYRSMNGSLGRNDTVAMYRNGQFHYTIR